MYIYDCCYAIGKFPAAYLNKIVSMYINECGFNVVTTPNTVLNKLNKNIQHKFLLTFFSSARERV